MTSSTLLVLLLGGGVSIGPAGPVGLTGGSLGPAGFVEIRTEATQPELEGAARRFARFWAAGESAALSDFVAAEGVRLHLDRADRSPLPARQAAAALRDYFAGHRPGSARLGRVAEVGGAPARGFAELIWEAAAAGTNETTEVTVYVGFVLEGNGEDEESWKVDEIRVLPNPI